VGAKLAATAHAAVEQLREIAESAAIGPLRRSTRLCTPQPITSIWRLAHSVAEASAEK
jgi:hypothetical protein